MKTFSDAKRLYDMERYAEARAALLPLMEQGNADAFFLMGEMYDAGEGVAEDDKEALRLYRLAARRGHWQARCQLAFWTLIGHHTRRRPQRARQMEERVLRDLLAQNQKDAEVQFRIGIALHIYMDRNEEAMTWFRRAARQGHADAMYYLAKAYSEGLGVRPSQGTARRWFARRSEQLRKEAEGGDVVTINELGDNLLFWEKKRDEAIPYLRRAADAGCTGASHTLGIYLDKEEEKVHYMRRAAEEGLAEAQVSMGTYCMYGWNGLEEDLGEAQRWFMQAVDQGCRDAYRNLGMLHKKILRFDEALRWFKKSSRQHDYLLMGRIYEEGGHGVERNMPQAMHCYSLAGESGWDDFFRLAAAYISEDVLTEDDIVLAIAEGREKSPLA